MTLRRKLAQAICALALHATPPQRRALARGMQAELDHIADGDVVGFALGCFSTAAGWWLTTAEGVTRSARMAISAASGGLAVFSFLTLIKLQAEASLLTLWSVAAIGTFYAGAAVVSFWQGLGALSICTIVGLALNAVAMLAQRAPGFEAEPGSIFLHALAIEEFGLLALMLGVSMCAQGVATRLR